MVDIGVALDKARELDTDLVEVAPEADPPVCRLMDYGKFKYKQKKRTHGGKPRHHATIKELRVKPKTGPHDIAVKVKHAREFLERKDKVSVSMIFKGREMVHADLGIALLKDFALQLEDIAKLENEIRRDGRRLGMTLSPK